jgi:hypothetical protein
MSDHTVTIELPEHIFQQLSQLAESIERPLAEIITQSIVRNLPPAIDKAIPELQPELRRMQSLPDTELLAIAQTMVTEEQHRYHEALLAKNASNSLSDSEQQELLRLRSGVDRQMIYKAYAWAILRWRGHTLPTLAEIPG